MAALALRERVFEALDNAVRNGYALHEWAASEVAVDLLTYCSDLEALEVETVLPYVVEWQVRSAGEQRV